MQEKIEKVHKEITRLLFDRLPDFATGDFETRWAECEAHAHNIAKLFERKVIWEGEAYVDAFGRIRFLDPQSGELADGQSAYDGELKGELFYPGLAAGKGTILDLAGQRVRVVVEEIE